MSKVRLIWHWLELSFNPHHFARRTFLQSGKTGGCQDVRSARMLRLTYSSGRRSLLRALWKLPGSWCWTLLEVTSTVISCTFFFSVSPFPSSSLPTEPWSQRGFGCERRREWRRFLQGWSEAEVGRRRAGVKGQFVLSFPAGSWGLPCGLVTWDVLHACEGLCLFLKAESFLSPLTICLEVKPTQHEVDVKTASGEEKKKKNIYIYLFICF